MTTIGRPRESHVKRDLRKCKEHGLTEFSSYVGTSATLAWRCMKCDCARSKQYRDNLLNPNRPTEVNTEVPKRALCETCHLELPATKICDNCN